MKKAMLLALALILAVMIRTAAAEVSENDAILCNIEDGSYIIRIPAQENDAGWYAEGPEGENAAVKLGSAGMEDGCFVVRYDPVSDGEAIITVRHFYCAVACDQVHTWYLAVQDGAIQEVTGGSYTAIPNEEEVDPVFSGKWMEKDTQFTQLTVEKNEAQGWDVEVTSPLTHGAYRFIATVYQDCYEHGFLYDKGELYDLPSDYTEGADLGEPALSGASGCFRFEADEGNLVLIWVRAENPGEIITFERVTEE